MRIMKSQIAQLLTENESEKQGMNFIHPATA